ncbi:DUF4391 domain-containing protein [Nitrosomonas sp.]|uniref:DUF4391 domain-containing protein n=1 Tax=Nitrosomonas sp. TaxID=42353 RepID=UPI00260BA2A4|nr:DUF4391 domain-containing protein [Nitrosomonas sp.]MCW5602823.1 DUF4391 domain-containing protein [Nitrosomonas sp.]
MSNSAFDDFLQSLAIPPSCALNKPVYKKLFLDASDGKKPVLDAADKACLKDDIDKIRWLYTLKPSTINIAPFADGERDYPEVAMLHFELSNANRVKRIAQFVNRAIPYPLILLFTCNPDGKPHIAINVTDKRINQVDKEKWVIEDSLTTPWIALNELQEKDKAFLQSLAINNLSFRNFFDFYKSLTERVIAINCASHSGAFSLEAIQSEAEGVSRLEKLRALEKLELKKSELANRLKKEKQMGKQVELNTQVKKINDEIGQIKASL